MTIKRKVKQMIFVMFAIVFTAFGCESTEDSEILDQPESDTMEEGLFFTTDRINYSIGDTVQFTIENKTDSVFYFSNCYDQIIISIQKNVDENWETIRLVPLICDDFGTLGNVNIDPGNSYRGEVIIYEETDIGIGTFRLKAVYINQIPSRVTYSLFSNVFDVQSETKEKGLFFTTDRINYSIGDTIQFTIQNRTDSVFYFYHCYDQILVSVEKKVDGIWETYSPAVCDDFGSGFMFTIDPGNSYQGKVTISEDTGTFRFKVIYRSEQAPPRVTYSLFSNVFDVQKAQVTISHNKKS